MRGREFWGLHAALVLCAGVLLLGCRSLFGNVLADDVAPQGVAADLRPLPG